MVPHRRPPPVSLPVSPVVLVLAAACAGALPGAGPNDALALLAAAAALVAGSERRHLAMLVAAGLATGLAPAGLLVVPLCIGAAIGRGAARQLPLAAVAAGFSCMLAPWHVSVAMLPNLAALAAAAPQGAALVAAVGAGCAAWLAAHAAASPPTGRWWHDARLCALVLTGILPLAPATLAFVVALAVLPWPVARRPSAANDNMPVRRVPIRLAA